MLSQNHHGIELIGALKGCLVLLPCNEQGHLQLHQVLRAQSNLTLNVSRDGASTTCLGNLCHCLTILPLHTIHLQPLLPPSSEAQSCLHESFLQPTGEI